MAIPINLPQRNSIQALWHLEEASGNRIDQSLNANTLTDNNTVTNAAAQIKNGASFAKANLEHLSRAIASCIGINDTTFTICAWVKHATGVQEPIVGGAGVAAVGARTFYITAVGKISLIKAYVIAIGTSDGTVGNNILTHVAVSYDGTNYVFYIGGSPSGNGANAQTFEYGDFYVGRISEYTGTSYYDGLIDELIIWNTILTAGEILRVKNITAYRYAAGGFSGTHTANWLFMKDMWEKHNKIFRPKLILPKDLGFSC